MMLSALSGNPGFWLLHPHLEAFLLSLSLGGVVFASMRSYQILKALLSRFKK
jgi:hypothetical protein